MAFPSVLSRCYRLRMEKGVIERAYELAPECSTIDEIRAALRRERHSNVDAHLSGPRIRADLKKLLRKTA